MKRAFFGIVGLGAAATVVAVIKVHQFVTDSQSAPNGSPRERVVTTAFSAFGGMFSGAQERAVEDFARELTDSSDQRLRAQFGMPEYED